MKIYPKKIIKMLFYAIIFFALLKPDSLEHIGLKWLDILLVIIDGLLMLNMVFFAILKRYRISETTILILCIYLIFGFSTIFGTKDIFTLIKVAGTAVGAGMFTDYCLQKNPELYFQSSIFTLLVLFSINFITIIKYYPIGMYKLDYVIGDLYFMGHDNSMIYNLIPLCSLSFIYSYVKKKKFWTVISMYSIALSLVSEIYVKSATGIIAIFVLILMLIIIDKKLLNKILNPKTLFILFIVLTFSVVILKVQNYFSWLFVNILGKDLTFTGRTYLWDYALSMIKEKLFLGYGMGVEVVGNGHTYPHAHSLLLDLLFKGGIMALLFFCILLLDFNKKYVRSKNKIISKLILIPIAGILLCEITSAMPYKTYFWSLFVLINYTNRINNLNGEKYNETE